MKIAQTVFLLSLNSNNNTAKRNTTDGTNFTLSLSLYYTPLFQPITLSLFLYLTNSNTKSLRTPLIQKGNVYAKISTTITTHMKFKKINCVNIYNVLSE